MRSRPKYNRTKYYWLAASVIALGSLAFTLIPLLNTARNWGGKADRRDEKAGKDPLYPKRWEEMFIRGRQTRDGRPAAAHRMEAKMQALRVPAARPGSPSHPGSVSSSAVGSCDWTEMGPAPEDDSVAFSTAYLYGNVSGRVASLALDLQNDPTANTLYVGAAYGGVWKTTNALSSGPTFTFIGDPQQTLAVGALALDTSVNPPIIYDGTGELNFSGDSYYGTGILKSSDGGNSWSLAPTANSGAISFLGLACSKILVDPTGPATVLAAMGFACCHPGINNTNQGIYRSTDHGATWNQVTTVNGGGQAIAGHSFTDIVYDGSATFYAAVRFQGVYYSTDHGASWTQATSPFPSGTAPSSTNFARASLASRGATLWCLASDSTEGPASPGSGDTGLSQSVNGGNTWTAVALPANVFGASGDIQGTYDQYVAAPSSSTALLVAGIDVFKANSVSGTSTSWTNLTSAYGGGTVHADQHAIAVNGPTTWFLGCDGGVWNTLNGGSAFSDMNTNLGTIQFYSVSPDPSIVGGFIGGSQDNGTAVNHNNPGRIGTEWFGGDGGPTDSNPLAFGQLYAQYPHFGTYWGVLRSDDYGADQFNSGNPVIDSQFSQISSDATGAFVPYQVVPGTPVSIILGTSRVWKGPGIPSGGVDGGGWSAISGYLTGSNSGFVLALAASASNPNYIYATTFDGTSVYGVYSNWGGGTWNNITSNLPTGNPIQGLAVDPIHPQIAYVGVQGFSGSSSGHVYQTTNAGASWTDIGNGLPDAPVNSLLVDPQFASDVYVADDVGVFGTQDVNGGATTWGRMGNALPDSTVLQIKMAPNCPRAILAATHGRGAWSICPLEAACSSSGEASILSAQAEPNITNGQTPVNFAVNLSQAAPISLCVYDVAQELVYSTSVAGTGGANTLTWPVKFQNGTLPASGIYIYGIQAGGDKKIGKVEVLH